MVRRYHLAWPKVGGADVVLGGGWDGGSRPPVVATVAYNDSDSVNSGWFVTMADSNSGISSSFAAVAECAPAGGATVALARPSPAGLRKLAATHTSDVARRH